MSSSEAAWKCFFCNRSRSLSASRGGGGEGRGARRSLPATHLLGVKQPMAVQPQPSLLPAEAAQLPLEMLQKARLYGGP